MGYWNDIIKEEKKIKISEKHKEEQSGLSDLAILGIIAGPLIAFNAVGGNK